MEFIDMLKKRRSIRQYSKEAVTGEQLQLVILGGYYRHPAVESVLCNLSYFKIK